MNRLKQWVQGGCLIQVTGQSFLGRFGPAARRTAESLMNADMVHVVASDAHDCFDRPPDLSRAYDHVCSRWGLERARNVFIENPSAVLADVPIMPGFQSRKRLTWSSLWSR
jgi:protein-tyrosine phosphatase